MLPLPSLQRLSSTLRDPNLPCILVDPSAAKDAIETYQRRNNSDRPSPPSTRRCYIEFAQPIDIAHHDPDSHELTRSIIIDQEGDLIIRFTAITASTDWDYHSW